jgi:hypothetical protein
LASAYKKAVSSSSDGGVVPSRKLDARGLLDILCDAAMGIMVPVMGPVAARKFLPMIGTLGFFILFANLMGLVPGFVPATDKVSTTLAASIIVFGAGGGLWFLSRPQVGGVTLEPSTGRLGAVLKKRAVVIGIVSGFFVVGSFSAIEAATVAAFGSEKNSIAGIVLGLWALSSLVAGLVMGHSPIGPWALSRRLSLVALGAGLAMFTLDPLLLTLALLVSGLGVAPAMTVQYAIATESVKKGDVPESLGWLGTGWVGGAAMASAVAGISIDTWGASGGFVVATIFAAVATLIPAIMVKSLPNLRHLADH